jgi:UbiA prenyltransferase family
MAVAVATSDGERDLRTLLTLGRVSNLPTVWSNCLAGWLLGGGGSAPRFGLLCLGASCLYLGGMFLNDAFDSDFDRQHRKERPIPSGAMSQSKVWGWGFGWLVAGILLLSLLGKTTMGLALILGSSILLYDAIHKAVTLSPLLMALCRFLLYLVAAAATPRGVTGLAVWSGLALGIYVVGLSYIARKESVRGPVQTWPCWPLAAPVVLAWIVNAGEYKIRSLVFALALIAWVAHCLRDTYWGATVSVGRTVSGLIAGICLVDLLAVAGGTPLTGLIFVLLFVAALLFQRFFPAT